MVTRRMKTEWLARGLLTVLIAVAIATPLAARWIQVGSTNGATLELHARMPENGGWSLDVIHAVVGQPVHLRLTSDDVIHSFAVGQTNWPALDVKPGEVVETSLLFDKPGRYTFYCTRWCGPNHWRMRGIIEVQSPSGASGVASLPTSEPPLYQKLGLDIDAAPQLSPLAEQSLNELKGLPSAERGAALHVELPAELRQHDWLRTHTPAEAFSFLRNNSAYNELLDTQLWDVVAFAWRNATADAAIARGAQLYTRDCVACHGETGRGDGPAGRDLPGLQAMMPGITMPDAKRGPADLTDLGRMAGLSDAQLQGKLLRGGMGTGMPEFGSLYTDDQQWAVIAFVRGFVMNLTTK